MVRLRNDSIERLLNRDEIKVGSMDTLEWHLAETLLIDLSQQDNGYATSVETSFDILHRLAEEAAMERPDDSTKGITKPRMDIYLLHAVLKHWNSCIRTNRTQLRPSQVRQLVDNLLQTSHHRLFTPNIATYTIIMDGATSCPDPQERLVFNEGLLSRLIQDAQENPLLQPTAFTFGTVIHALAKSNSATLAEKAEGLLRRMKQLHESGWNDVEPNTVVYTTVIHAWANAGQADRAEALLQEMYKDAVLHGNDKVQPNTRTFNTVLLAWSKSPDPNRVESAEVLLHRMISMADDGRLPIAPDLVSYNLMLSTIGRGRKNAQAWTKAEHWMRELISLQSSSSNLVPNHVTYKTLFRILTNSDVTDKANRARYWLNLCVDEDVKNDKVLQKRIEEMELGENLQKV
ncbi:PPR: pentatricopeptide repeat domain containing protein [Nitzschia inconspicua]|uniref:PPR: pentatricopeptide repeat domain containing protein n=1 Tax=Nitzschia inconspicua TaxID=303405 RepID=A0A9K3PGN9_9STRA|nr:PPR: pentatricopeptide repeat domain containing protein [Nitzschia inconspicua]